MLGTSFGGGLKRQFHAQVKYKSRKMKSFLKVEIAFGQIFPVYDKSPLEYPFKINEVIRV